MLPLVTKLDDKPIDEAIVRREEVMEQRDVFREPREIITSTETKNSE